MFGKGAGLPVEFTVSSLGETQMKPTAMLFQNMLSINVEECIRANGMVGVFLLGGATGQRPDS